MLTLIFYTYSTVNGQQKLYLLHRKDLNCADIDLAHQPIFQAKDESSARTLMADKIVGLNTAECKIKIIDQRFLCIRLSKHMTSLTTTLYLSEAKQAMVRTRKNQKTHASAYQFTPAENFQHPNNKLIIPQLEEGLLPRCSLTTSHFGLFNRSTLWETKYGLLENKEARPKPEPIEMSSPGPLQLIRMGNQVNSPGGTAYKPAVNLGEVSIFTAEANPKTPEKWQSPLSGTKRKPIFNFYLDTKKTFLGSDFDPLFEQDSKFELLFKKEASISKQSLSKRKNNPYEPKRSLTQKQVMDNISANQASETMKKHGLLPADHPVTEWEWCHLIAHCLIKDSLAQQKNNLVLGSFACNSWMTHLEKILYDLVRSGEFTAELEVKGLILKENKAKTKNELYPLHYVDTLDYNIIITNVETSLDCCFNFKFDPLTNQDPDCHLHQHLKRYMLKRLREETTYPHSDTNPENCYTVRANESLAV